MKNEYPAPTPSPEYRAGHLSLRIMGRYGLANLVLLGAVLAGSIASWLTRLTHSLLVLVTELRTH